MKDKYFIYGVRPLRSLTDEYLDMDDIKNDILYANMIIRIAEETLAKYSSRDKKKIENKSEVARNERSVAWAVEQKRLLEEKLASLPPSPLLPPPEPLVKISGTIEHVSFTKMMACFDAGAYSTKQDSLARKQKRDEIGTIAAMTAQALAGDAPHVGETKKYNKKQKCLYVQGKLEGKSFSGWFGMTNLRPGDKVEMAVMPAGDNFLVYAIANPELRTISVTPGCASNGSIFSVRNYMLCSHLVFLPLYLFIFFQEQERLLLTVWYCAICTVLSIVAKVQDNYAYGEQRKLHDRIISALELSDNKKFDLIRNAANISKQKRKKGEIIIREEGTLPMPQGGGKGYYSEYFYYY